MTREHAYVATTMALCGFGAVLSFAIAMVPMIAIGHLLRVDLLLVGLLPYVVYACGAWLRRDRLSLLLGAALLAGDLGLRLPAGYSAQTDLWNHVVFIWPLLVTAVLTLVYWVVPTSAEDDAQPAA